ncbi:KIF13B [Symbiodinium natans]|uniref:Kinesin-like protein n=1 Tax=Symbiodinium natans TaxID=878477 RepID=A0A812UR00_9DINO|nr:KIF13B [Symbiodinium natans]
MVVLHVEQVLPGESGATSSQPRWRHSKLQVVDLAGAEHMLSGDALRQRGPAPINHDLSALADMIETLAKGERDGPSQRHYRDSKLSWLLSESLMGSCRTAMVTCVSPASRRVDLTSSSLRFAEMVQKIHTRPTRNEEVHGDLVQTLRGEICLLRHRLDQCSPEQIRDLEEQLHAAQYLEDEFSASFEELQVRASAADEQRRRTLRQLGLQVGEKLGEQKVSDGFIYVVNVSLDPLLSGCLTWTMTPGEQLRIGSDPSCEICVDGLGVQAEVCSLRCAHASRLEVVPQLVNHTAKTQDGMSVRRSLFKRAGPVLVNGQAVEAALALRSGDVLRVGWAHFFRVLIPMCASENDRRLGPRPEDTLAIETTYGFAFSKDAEQLTERLGADRAAQVLGGLKDLKLAVDEANELTQELRGGDHEELVFKGHLLTDPLDSTEAATVVVSLRRAERQPHFGKDSVGSNGEVRGEVVATWTLPDFQHRLEVMREIYDEVSLRDEPWGEPGDLDPWQAQSSIPVFGAKEPEGPHPETAARTVQEVASRQVSKQLTSATSASTGTESDEPRMDLAAILQQLPQLHAELAKAYEIQGVQASELVSVRREIEDLRLNLAKATPSPARRPGDPSRSSGTLSPLRGEEMPLLSKSNLVPSHQPHESTASSTAAVREMPVERSATRASTPRRPPAPVWRGAEGPRVLSSPTGASNGPLASSHGGSPLAEAQVLSPKSAKSEQFEASMQSEDPCSQGSTLVKDVSFAAGIPDTIKYYVSPQSLASACPGGALNQHITQTEVVSHQLSQMNLEVNAGVASPFRLGTRDVPCNSKKKVASLKEATGKEEPWEGLGSDAAARIAILFGKSASASFHSKWEVLLGQGEVQNWMKSTPGHDVQMRYPGEWKFAGGVVDADETPEEAARRELEEEFQVPVALTKATCKLRLMSIKQTRPIRNISNIMFNYVAAAEENPWLQLLDVEALA